MKSNTDELLTKYGVYPVQPMKYPTAERSRLRIVPSPQHSEEIMETDGGADVAEQRLGAVGVFEPCFSPPSTITSIVAALTKRWIATSSHFKSALPKALTSSGLRIYL